MRRVYFINLLFILAIPSLAQKLTGTVRQAGGNVPVPFATVALLRPDSTILVGTLADGEGRYELAYFAPGTYRVAASMVGYKPTVLAATKLGTSAQVLDIALAEQTTTLGEVTVKARKPFIEVSAEKTLVNVEGSVAATGMMATDILRRAPGVQLDNQGNLSLKGKANVLVLLDGKPALLDQKQLAALLRGLPANQISQIEVMTNPPARYDAQGNAGVINIRLKRNRQYGTNGTLTVSQGQGRYHKHNSGLSLSHRAGRLNLSGNYDYTNSEDYNEFLQTRTTPDAPTTRLDGRQDYRVPTHGHTAKIGLDWMPTDRTSLDLTATGQWNTELYLGQNENRLLDRTTGTLQSRTLTTDRNPDTYRNRSARLGIRHQFDSTGHELTVWTDLARYGQQSTQDALTRSFGPIGIETGRSRLVSTMPSQTDIWVAAADYTRPLGKTVSLEAGLKLTQIGIDTDVRVFGRDEAGRDTFLPERSSSFIYDEQIQAGYVSGQWQRGKWQLRGGLRLENWRARGNQRLTGQRFQRDSLFVFPSASAQFKLSDNQQVAFSYSRRIDRPGYDALNPIAYYTDPFTIFVGNPALRPQLTHNLELSHTLAEGLLVTTVNVSRTDDFMVEYVPTLVPGQPALVQALTTQNIARLMNMGVAVSLNVPITSWWATETYLNVYRNRFMGTYADAPLDNARWMGQYTLTQRLTLPRAWTVELIANGQTATTEGIATYRPTGQLTIGIQKSLWQEAATFRLALQDAFRTYRFAGDIRVGPFNNTNSYRWDNRILTASLTWRWGKQTTRSEKKAIGDEDSRTGGGRR